MALLSRQQRRLEAGGSHVLLRDVQYQTTLLSLLSQDKIG